MGAVLLPAQVLRHEPKIYAYPAPPTSCPARLQPGSRCSGVICLRAPEHGNQLSADYVAPPRRKRHKSATITPRRASYSCRAGEKKGFR